MHSIRMLNLSITNWAEWTEVSCKNIEALKATKACLKKDY